MKGIFSSGLFKDPKGKKLILSFHACAMYLATLFVLFLLPLTGLADNDGKVNKVVIDAGHGGKDSGALGQKSQEKDIALAIALKTGEYISKNYPDVEVIYTRSKDEFIPLYKRAETANRNHADLFISIHCNAVKSKSPFGTETFVMGLHKSEANLDVAKFENASMLLEDDYSERYEGYDPNSPESHIIFSLYQNIYREQSLVLASTIQDQFTEKIKRFNRGVKEAGFLVLYKTAMPGVLIEAGFLSNASEEKFLISANGQNQIASAIFRAFRQYKHDVENTPLTKLIYNEDSADRLTTNDTFIPPAEIPKSETVKIPEQKITIEQKQTDELVFRVQIAISPQKIKPDDKRFKNLNDIFEYRHQGIYKYCAGSFTNEEDALKYRNLVKQQGFNDAFVVVFRGKERIGIEEARKKK